MPTRRCADIESGYPGVEKRGDPALKGPIEVSVGCHGVDFEKLEHALKEAGGAAGGNAVSSLR
jgi:hypothetical protein